MIGFFRNNLFFNSLMLLPYAFVLRIYSLLHPSVYVTSGDDTYISEVIYTFITNGLAQSIFACILVFVQAVYINKIAIKHRLIKEFTLLPGLFYILLTSFLPSFLELSPILIGNTFIIMAFSQVSKTYKKPKAANHIYNTGLFIGISSLFYIPALIFYLAGWIGLVIMRSFKRIDKIQFLSGIITPYILLSSWLFYKDSLSEHLIQDLSGNLGLFSSFGTLAKGNLYVIAVVLVVAIYFIFGYNKYTLKKSIQAQKKIDMLYWILFSALLGLTITFNFEENYILYLCFPYAVFMTMSFLNLKNNMVAELLHVVFITIIGMIHFGILPLQ